MQIIGLTGQPFNGKDTAARYLADAHGFYPIAFADPLRAGLKAMLGLTDDDFSPERKERVIHWLGKTPVQLLESLGTAWGQTELYRQVWCDRAVHTMTALLDSKRRFVFTDIRFVHEAKMLQQFDGKLLRIVRPGAPRSARAGCASFQEQMRLVADADVVAESVAELHEALDDVLYQFRLLEDSPARRISGAGA